MCNECRPGRYQPHHRQLFCIDCPTGWHRLEAEDTNATECHLCKAGETSRTNGSAICENCDLGEYGFKNGTCEFCPKGYYQDSKGETFCKACPVDHFETHDKPNEAATSESDCLKCVITHALSTTTSQRTGVFNATTGCICAGAQQEAVDLEMKYGYYTTNMTVYELKKPIVSDRQLCIPCPDGADCEVSLKNTFLSFSFVFRFCNYLLYLLHHLLLDLIIPFFFSSFFSCFFFSCSVPSFLFFNLKV